MFFPLLVIATPVSYNAISMEKKKKKKRRRKKCMFSIGACLFRIFLDLSANVQEARGELHDYPFSMHEIGNEL
jgi:hypothetical protein